MNNPTETFRLIVADRSGQWAAAVRRVASAGAGSAWLGRIRETRSLGECESELAAWPGSLVAVVVETANFAPALAWFARLGARFPHARAVGLVGRGCAEQGWALREAGAIHVVESPRRLPELVQLATRQMAVAPAREMGVIERIEASLPWKRNSA